ncbi:MAG: response regulator [Deltaproteobacteria bacterium]|nr:response regulator [Deltaproteobacteria bacterium]
MTDAATRQVLVVDDDVGVSEFLASFFALANIRAVVAETILEAHRTLEKEVFQVVFVDKHLPDGNGIDFAGEAKRSFPGTMFVVLTGAATPTTMGAAEDAGVERCLAKPLASLEPLEEICESAFGATWDEIREGR